MHLVAPALEVTALPPLALPKKRVEIGAFSDQLTGAAVIAGDPIGRTNRNEEKRAKKRQVWSLLIQLPHLYLYFDCFSMGEYSGAGWVISST